MCRPAEGSGADDRRKRADGDGRKGRVECRSQGTAGERLRHLGIQVEDTSELEEVYSRLERADAPVLEEGATTCCYAKSQKSWIEDPQGVKWETFLTTGSSTVYGSDPVQASKSPCCEPKAA